MSKHRYAVLSDRNLRLQEMVPERRIRLPYPPGPQHLYKEKADRETEQDTVAALAWPRQAGWRHH